MMDMIRKMTREELKKAYEKKLARYDRALKSIEYLRDRVAVYDKCSDELRRAARTHRLCTRGGMLERELHDPELLQDDQVEELIRMAFAHEDVQQRLREMVNYVYDHPEDVNL